jgi:hypothetical protein
MLALPVSIKGHIFMPANPYAVTYAVSDPSTAGGDTLHEDTPDEDMPQAAIQRWLEVRSLKKKLIEMTRGLGCTVIQTEPSKALCRYLFSSKLAERRCLNGDASTTRDALLPNLAEGVYYDKSICKELQHKPEFARQVCDSLCRASRLAIERVENSKMGAMWEVQILREGRNWRVGTGNVSSTYAISPQISICIEDKLFQQLRRMYFAVIPKQAKSCFNRRLFCLLMRYQSLGGTDNIVGSQHEGGSLGTFHAASRIFLPEAWALFQHDLGVTMECTASPFNRTAPIYWSAFTDTDRFFGSKGNFFDASDTELGKGGSFMADGPPEEETLDRLEKRIHEVLELTTKLDNPTSFVIGYPAWEDMSCWKNLRNSKYLVYHVKNCAIVHHLGRLSLFILQNERGKEQWPVTPVLEARLNSTFRVNA